MVKNLPAMWETWVHFLDWENPLEKGLATHSSIPAWRIPWTEEPGGLQSIGSQRVRHNWRTNTFTFHIKVTFDLTLVFLHAPAKKTKKQTVSLKLGSSVLTSSSPGPPRLIIAVIYWTLEWIGSGGPMELKDFFTFPQSTKSLPLEKTLSKHWIKSTLLSLTDWIILGK